MEAELLNAPFHFPLDLLQLFILAVDLQGFRGLVHLENYLVVMVVLNFVEHGQAGLHLVHKGKLMGLQLHEFWSEQL